MYSIFDLPKNVTTDIMSKNSGITQNDLRQVPPSRDVVSTAFPNGDLRFKFTVPSGKYWLPDRSYLRAQFTLTTGTDAQIKKSDQVAAAQNLLGNIFQTCEVQLDGKSYSKTSSYVAQVSALETRMTKSRGWFQSIGSASNFWDTLQVRQVNISSDGSEIGDVPSSEAVTSQAVLGIAANKQVAATVQTAGLPALITFSVGDPIPKATLEAAFPTGSTVRFGAALGGVTEAVVSGHAINILYLGGSPIADAVAAVVAVSRVQYGQETSRRVKSFECIWTPPLSLLKLTHGIPGGFTAELILQPMPSSSYEKQAIQTVLGTTKEAGALVTDFKLRLVNMYYYTHIVEGPRVNTESYIMDLASTSCQSVKILVHDSSQYIFEVPVSTNALTFAIQDTRAGSNSSMSPSEFKAYNEAGTASIELGISRFSIDYAGQRYPSPDSQPVISAGQDYGTQAYLNSQINSGMYENEGGCETLKEFRSRGAYYTFETPKDGKDASTRVLITLEFAGLTDLDVKNARILLFAHSTQLASINMVDSMIRDVVIGDA